MNICICDDDILVHKKIENLLNKHFIGESFNILNFSSAEDMLNHTKTKYDIIFFDIEMKGINGIEAAEIIRERQNKSIIIFVSGHENYIYDVFHVEPLHFIRKPINEVEFNDVFTRAINKYNSINQSITVKWEYERYNIIIDEIMFVEGYKRHITIYTKNNRYESIGKLSDMYSLLSPHGFIQIHQGFLVNMDYIKTFENTDIVLSDGRKVMMSVRKKTAALKAYDKYILNKKW